MSTQSGTSTSTKNYSNLIFYSVAMEIDLN